MNNMECKIELEKKYLIEYPELNLIMKKYNVIKYEIEQIYLLSDSGSRRIRMRREGDKTAYIETVKIRINGSKSYEYERELTADEYESLKAEADPERSPIYKDRYVFPYKNKVMELDVYPFWEDKAVLEIELESEEDKYFIPEEIKVIADVSDDPKYKNAALAKSRQQIAGSR
jgi:CYTH domain-containing protein